MKILKAGRESMWRHNNMRVMLAPNTICNFSCSYCINAKQRADKSKFISKEALELLMQKLSALKKEKYNFNIAGGEPLLYPHLDALFDYLDNCFEGKVSASISTNGFFLPKKQCLFSKMHNATVRIVISTHFEQLSVDGYINILNALDNKNRVLAKIMLEPGKLCAAKKLQEFCEVNGVSYFMHALTLEGKLQPDYSEEELAFIQKYSYFEDEDFFYTSEGAPEKIHCFSRVDGISNTEFINYKGMYCSAGFSSICMTAEEKISQCFKAQKKVFSSEELDNIFSSPIICPSDQCACPALFSLPKWLTPEDAPEYIKNKQHCL